MLFLKIVTNLCRCCLTILDLNIKTFPNMETKHDKIYENIIVN